MEWLWAEVADERAPDPVLDPGPGVVLRCALTQVKVCNCRLRLGRSRNLRRDVRTVLGAVEVDSVDRFVRACASLGEVLAAGRDGEHPAARAHDGVTVTPGARVQDVRVRGVLCRHRVEA